MKKHGIYVIIYFYYELMYIKLLKTYPLKKRSEKGSSIEEGLLN